MESVANVRMEDDTEEVIQVAIEQLVEQKKSERSKADDENKQLLLSKLLSQRKKQIWVGKGESHQQNFPDRAFVVRFESVKKGNTMCESLVESKEPLAVVEAETNKTDDGSSGRSKEIGTEEIVNELETNKIDDGSSGGSKEIETEEIVKELRQLKRQNTITHWLLSIMIVLTAAWQFSEVTLLWKVKRKVTQPFKSVQNLITGAQDALRHLDSHEPDAARKNHHTGSSALKIPVPDLPYMDTTVLGLKGDVVK